MQLNIYAITYFVHWGIHCYIFFQVGENNFKKHDPNFENNKRRKHPRVITFV